MADVNVTITIPEMYISRIISAFTGYANISLDLSTESGRWGFSYLPKQTGETNMDFGERVIKNLILALVRCYELDQDYIRYRNAVGAVTPPSQSVPDGIVI